MTSRVRRFRRHQARSTRRLTSSRRIHAWLSGFESPPAIIADRQKNLHELHGVSFGSTRDNSPSPPPPCLRRNGQPVSQSHVLQTVPTRAKRVLPRRRVAAFPPRNN